MKLFTLILTLLLAHFAHAVPGMDTLGDLRAADILENGQPRNYIHTEFTLRQDLILERSRQDRELESQPGMRFLSARLGPSCMVRTKITSDSINRIRLVAESKYRLDSTVVRRFQNNQVFIAGLLHFAPWENGQAFGFYLTPRNKEINERTAGHDSLESLEIHCKYLGARSSLIEAEVMMGMNFRVQW